MFGLGAINDDDGGGTGGGISRWNLRYLFVTKGVICVKFESLAS